MNAPTNETPASALAQALQTMAMPMQSALSGKASELPDNVGYPKIGDPNIAP